MFIPLVHSDFGVLLGVPLSWIFLLGYICGPLLLPFFFLSMYITLMEGGLHQGGVLGGLR